MMRKSALIRMSRFVQVASAVVLLTLLAWPVSVNACACCSEPGLWYETTERMQSYQWAEIEKIKFGGPANLYMNAAGEDGIVGVSNPAEEYSLTLAQQGRTRWELRFKDKAGRAGTLALTVPNTITVFEADIHDGQTSAGGGPLLYKEWRLTGAAVGTGVFRKGSTAQTKYRLVFQGRGNACTSAEMFDNWKLQIFGPRASYSFYGKLKQLASAKS
jgi:hypothetical protein